MSLDLPQLDNENVVQSHNGILLIYEEKWKRPGEWMELARPAK